MDRYYKSKIFKKGNYIDEWGKEINFGLRGKIVIKKRKLVMRGEY